MISVIVPVYNSECYIDKCIKSILNQTYRDIEIILINDGSTDESAKNIEKWAQIDSRIKTIHQSNLGPSIARNRGLDIASGDEIIFIDSDDIIAENMCEKLHQLLSDYEAEIAICGIKHIFNNEDEKFTNDSGEISIYTPKEAIIDMWYQKKIIPSPCARIFKRKIFDTVKFKENIIFEDVEIMPKLFQKAKNIVYDSTILYGYNHHEGSITTNPFSKKDLEILNIAYNNYQFALEKDKDFVDAALSYYIVAALRIYLNAPKKYSDSIISSKKIIDKYGKLVLKNKQIKKKVKYALILYLYARPVLNIVYRRINRWK